MIFSTSLRDISVLKSSKWRTVGHSGDIIEPIKKLPITPSSLFILPLNYLHLPTVFLDLRWMIIKSDILRGVRLSNRDSRYSAEAELVVQLLGSLIKNVLGENQPLIAHHMLEQYVAESWMSSIVQCEIVCAVQKFGAQSANSRGKEG